MWTSPQEIEKDFLNSIFAAAYMREDLAEKETENFLKMTSMQGKAAKLQEVMRIIEKLPKDKTSCDPENGYNRALVAAWSSFMLVNHHWINSKKENDYDYQLTTIVNKNLEVPLRKYIPQIRGAPFYLNSKF
jgi:hypothetical protein